MFPQMQIFEKVLAPLEHRINKVATTERGCEHSTARHRISFATPVGGQPV